MSRHHFLTCDVCNQEILPKDPPHQTRRTFERTYTEGYEGHDVIMTVELPRRDMHEHCAVRVRQAIVAVAELHNCMWLLDGFEVERK